LNKKEQRKKSRRKIVVQNFERGKEGARGNWPSWDYFNSGSTGKEREGKWNFFMPLNVDGLEKEGPLVVERSINIEEEENAEKGEGGAWEKVRLS